MQKDKDFTIKILLVGNHGVGKSTLIKSQMDSYKGQTPESKQMGNMTYYTIKHTIYDIPITIKVWDTPGGLSHTVTIREFIKDANAIFLCFGYNDPESF